MSKGTNGKTKSTRHSLRILMFPVPTLICSVDPQIDIPAPKAIAKYIYDNQQHNLSLQTQMVLQDDRETLTDMIVCSLCRRH